MRSHENTESRSVVSSYPAAGFQDDVAKLLQRFVATKSIRFEEFLKVWKASNFTFIFLGRSGLREQHEFLEEAFRILLKYILPPYNLQVRVGGIYTLYSIYNSQHVKHKTKIRIPLSCWPNFCDLEKEILQHKHLDAAFIIRKLNVDRAILLCAYPSMLSIDEMYVMTGLPGDSHADTSTPAGVYEEKNSLSHLIEDDTIGQLDAVHEKYHQLKCSYNGIRNGETDSPASSLNLIKADFARTILNIVNPPKQTSSRYSTKEQSENESEKRALKLKSLKQVALLSKVEEVRQLKRGPGRPSQSSTNKLIQRPLRGEITQSGLIVRKRGRPTASAPKIRLSDIPSEPEDLSESDDALDLEKQSDNPCDPKNMAASTPHPENTSDNTSYSEKLSNNTPDPNSTAKRADTEVKDVASSEKNVKQPWIHPSKLAKRAKDIDFVPTRSSYPSERRRSQPSRSSRSKSIDFQDEDIDG